MYWKSYPQARKKVKGTQIGEEVVKLSLFADNRILYREKSPKESTRKPPELINENSKLAEFTKAVLLFKGRSL